MSIDGSHRALYDARNSGEILIKLIKELAGFEMGILSRMNNLFGDRNLFNSIILNNIPHHENISDNNKNFFKPKDSFLIYETKENNDTLHLEKIMGEDGLLYNNSIYQFRKSQYKRLNYNIIY